MLSFSELRDRAEMLTPPLPWDRPQWHRRDGPTVVLLHGLWRGWRAMQPMARALEREGFSTLNIPYPSGRLPIETLVSQVRAQIEKVADERPIHFITHSLGGIILRAILAQDPVWKTGRIIMLAPPNRGSEIIDWSRDYPLLHLAIGPAGRALGSDGVPPALPPLPAGTEAAVIMGDRCSIPFFKQLLGDRNDGIVSAANGVIDGLRGFTVVHADHTFIQMHPETIRLALRFLENGAWDDQF